jgi:hypothetical protein
MNRLCLPPASCWAYFSSLKIEAICSSDAPYGVTPQKNSSGRIIMQLICALVHALHMFSHNNNYYQLLLPRCSMIGVHFEIDSLDEQI